MTDPIKHLNKMSERRLFLITLSQREGERREVRRRGGDLYDLQFLHIHIIIDL